MSYDTDVVAATSGRGEGNWDQIIKLCDRIQQSVGPTSMSQAMGSVLKRVRHSDPNVQLQALTLNTFMRPTLTDTDYLYCVHAHPVELLEACVSNCGKEFQLELTKPTFHSDARAILMGPYSDPRVTLRLKELLASWANEFKSDSRMNGLIRFVDQLRQDGINFAGPQQSTPAATTSAAPITTSAKEEDDLRKAIQLSLKDSQPPPPSLYPSFTASSTSSPSPKPQPKKSEERKVRAIYDFVAAEDNELSFRAGEIVILLDDSDENWWRGRSHLGEGLFPASFVSKNLSVDPEPSKREKKEKKSKQQRGGGKKAETVKKVEVNEEQLDLLLDMLKEADVTTEENQAENQTLLELEEQCKQMRPAVDESIAALQRQEDEMQGINHKFQEALAMYRKMLAEGPKLSTIAAAQPPSNAPQHPLPPNPVPPSQPLTNMPPPSLPSHPYPSTYHPATSIATGYSSAQGVLYGAEASVVPGMQDPPPTHTLTQVQQPSLYQPQVQPVATQQPPSLMTGVPLSIPMATQPVPPPYQPPLYQPQPVQHSLIQQPLL